jgi:hypothetical protein
MSEWMESYREKIREYLQEHGCPMEFDSSRPYSQVSPYGYTDFEAWHHADSCGGWVIPPGSTVEEVTYSMFTNTFSPNEQEVGLNVTPARCACGEYTNTTLRWKGSMTELLHAILGIDNIRPSWKL